MRTGTSSIVVAAFVGPGTVLTCASAGVDFGYDLAWVLVFATVTAFVLQSFTAGTGILARRGLGEAIRTEMDGRRSRVVVTALVVLGLWVGCASFELGNLIGAAAGITALLDLGVDLRWIVAVLAGCAAVILLLDLRVLIRVFAALVIGMSVLFLLGLALAPVDWGAALTGLAVPSVPEGAPVRVVALIGTTVVTYNLFLHPSAARQYWMESHDLETNPDDRRAAWRGELRGMMLFLPIGGVVSFAILAAGATLHGSGAEVSDVEAFAALLEPVAGRFARICFGLGLFAAGLTSSLTAPLAAASGICEIFGWDADPSGRPYRAVWASVLGTGAALGLLDLSPLPAIVAAQAANGLLLPFTAAFVLWLTVRQDVVRLPLWYRALGAAVTLVCTALGARTLWWVWQQV
jgi:NRAMP (natural resistance-associated macrophage protein)-like metal ion transporter